MPDQPDRPDQRPYSPVPWQVFSKTIVSPSSQGLALVATCEYSQDAEYIGKAANRYHDLLHIARQLVRIDTLENEMDTAQEQATVLMERTQLAIDARNYLRSIGEV